VNLVDIEQSEFGRGDFEILERETAFQGFFRLSKVNLRHRLFAGGWSKTLERELFDKTEASVAVIYDPTNDLIGLVEQFRVGMIDDDTGPWSLEGVAGLIEPGETPEAMIKRELEEEAGIVSAELRAITSFYASPGSCNEVEHLFCALCDLSDAGGIHGLVEEGEDIRFNTYPAQEVFNFMFSSRRMNNAATLIGLMWLQLNRAELMAAALSK